MNRFDMAKKGQPEPLPVNPWTPVGPVAPITSEPDNFPFFDFRRGNLSYENFLKSFTDVSKLDKILSPISPNDLADLFAKVEEKNLRVDTVLMNARRFSDVRKWGRDILDIATDRGFLARGLIGSIWGANIFITKKMPEDAVIITSEEEHRTCAMLEVGQERIFGLTGLCELMDEIKNQRNLLNNLYDQLEKMILNSLTEIEQTKNGKQTQS